MYNRFVTRVHNICTHIVGVCAFLSSSGRHVTFTGLAARTVLCRQSYGVVAGLQRPQRL